jgi:hypothetical protein
MVFYNSMVIVFAGYQRVLSENQMRPLGYVFNKVLSLTPNIEQTASWHQSSSSTNMPSVRFAHSAVQFGEDMFIYAGRFKQMRDDMYKFNVSSVDESDIQVEAEIPTDFQTMHFMVAILCMMVLCFCVFVFSLRRRYTTQNNDASFHRDTIAGASQRVINRLPTVSFKCTDGEDAADKEADKTYVAIALLACTPSLLSIYIYIYISVAIAMYISLVWLLCLSWGFATYRM